MRNRLPEGPGSRGGSWHDPEFRNAYRRAWRAAHPEYRAREALRMARRRSEQREADAHVAAFTDTVLLVVAEDVAARGVTAVARTLGVNHRTVGRWLDGSHCLGADGVDAAVAAYGADAIAVIHGLALDEDVERRRAAAMDANFRGRNQYTTRGRGSHTPADTAVKAASPRHRDEQEVVN